ncbi:urease accessory protein UreD [Micromonospora pisi]|uniref:urease accessory protein UreD n=1 Tax=Micromonospora pisi TaxID=589240 RepID=UPI001FE4ADE8|nr:urease accessory protein UreD [Micromonospora pisi]
MAVADGARGTRLAELHGEAPLLLRRTRAVPTDDGEVQVHLVGGAAGPLGGDRLRIELTVGAGALLCVRSVAASLVLPGAGGERSRLEVTARVEAGGRLRWLPEPLIGAARCDHLSRSVLELADGAALVWRDELVCGRHGEPVGDVRIDTTLRYGGRTLLRNELAVGPRAPGWSGPAGLGAARVTGSLLLVDPTWAVTGPPGPAPLGPYAARLPLAGGPAVLLSATGADLATVRDALDGSRVGASLSSGREGK